MLLTCKTFNTGLKFKNKQIKNQQGDYTMISRKETSMPAGMHKKWTNGYEEFLPSNSLSTEAHTAKATKKWGDKYKKYLII